MKQDEADVPGLLIKHELAIKQLYEIEPHRLQIMKTFGAILRQTNRDTPIGSKRFGPSRPRANGPSTVVR